MFWYTWSSQGCAKVREAQASHLLFDSTQWGPLWMALIAALCSKHIHKHLLHNWSAGWPPGLHASMGCIIRLFVARTCKCLHWQFWDFYFFFPQGFKVQGQVWGPGNTGEWLGHLRLEKLLSASICLPLGTLSVLLISSSSPSCLHNLLGLRRPIAYLTMGSEGLI